MLGIVFERDVVWWFNERGAVVFMSSVVEIMIIDVVICSDCDSVDSVVLIMTEW